MIDKLAQQLSIEKNSDQIVDPVIDQLEGGSARELDQLTFALDLFWRAFHEAVVADYLRLPDRKRSGRGMTAGGSLSPLLAAVMLIPLDEAMNRLWRRYGLFYVRYIEKFLVRE
ncbi:MAG: hypothetical protein ACKVJG_05955 [Candidatus Latescibacterota bacterium]|jgi:hypothetical protein